MDIEGETLVFCRYTLEVRNFKIINEVMKKQCYTSKAYNIYLVSDLRMNNDRKCQPL